MSRTRLTELLSRFSSSKVLRKTKDLWVDFPNIIKKFLAKDLDFIHVALDYYPGSSNNRISRLQFRPYPAPSDPGHELGIHILYRVLAVLGRISSGSTKSHPSPMLISFCQAFGISACSVRESPKKKDEPTNHQGEWSFDKANPVCDALMIGRCQHLLQHDTDVVITWRRLIRVQLSVVWL